MSHFSKGIYGALERSYYGILECIWLKSVKLTHINTTYDALARLDHDNYRYMLWGECEKGQKTSVTWPSAQRSTLNIISIINLRNKTN